VFQPVDAPLYLTFPAERQELILQLCRPDVAMASFNVHVYAGMDGRQPG
jgi:hypothetical protein